MDEPGASDDRLLSWRVAQLETIEAAMRVEIHDLRTELQTALRAQRGPTMSAMRTVFVTRKELDQKAAERREWWPIIFAGICALTSLANIVSVIGGH